MPKLNLKTIGIAVGALLGVVVIAAVLFIVFFPADLAAREAERRIEATTGRQLTLGEVSVTFWPALGFSAEQVSLSNPPDFDEVARRGGTEAAEAPFITANRIVFAVAVLPLLRGEIQVKTLIFDGAEVRLRAKEDGTGNWTFPTEEEQEQTLDDLRLDDVQLNDSMIVFQGARGEPLTMEDVDARLRLDSLDQPARLESAFTYRGERLEVDGDVGNPRAVLEQGETPLTVNARGAPITAAFNGAFNAQSGALTGQVEANGTSLRRLLAWIGSPLPDGGGFAAFSLNSQVARLGERTDLTNAVINLDAIEARGTLALIGQENDRLRVTGGLNVVSLDLNPYLPTPAQGAEAGGVAVETAWSSDPLDLTGLRALDADLNLAVNALRFQRLNFSNVTLGMRIANGALDARLTRIGLYGGAGTARMIADGSGATPRIAIELNAENVQAEPLLRDAIGFDSIVGRGRLRASLIGVGASQAALMRSLDGRANFSFNDGQWKGVNLGSVARTVQAAITGQTQSGGGATDFAELAADFTISNGVAATDNLRLLNPYVRLEGQGLINIGAQTIDMRLEPRAVNSREGQGGDASMAGLGVPFRASGPWSRVSFQPALGDAVRNELRERARGILGSQEAGSPLATLGEALFGRAPAAEAPPPAPAPNGDQPAQQQPAQQQPAQEEERRNPLEDILRRARAAQEQQRQEEAPAPTP